MNSIDQASEIPLISQPDPVTEVGMASHETNPAQEPKPSYPIYAFDEALAIAKAVVDLGGNKVPVKKEALARHMKYAETGPSFVQRLGAARSFGMIQGRGEYSLTENAKRYFYPNSGTDKARAAFRFLKSPKVFGMIVTRFHGDTLPSNEIIGNIMHTEADVPVSWKDKAAAIFVRSVRAADALDSSGKLRSDDEAAMSDGAPEDKQGDGIQDDRKTPPPPVQPKNNHSFDMPLANDRKVTVSAPRDLTDSEMKRLQAWLPLTFLVDWKPNNDSNPT